MTKKKAKKKTSKPEAETPEVTETETVHAGDENGGIVPDEKLPPRVAPRNR